MTPFRLRILAGAAVSAVMATGAYGQTSGEPYPFEANEASVDEAGRVRLSGDVEVTNDGRTLRAQEMTLDPDASVVTASGGVRLFQPNGSVEYADSLIFDETLTTGVATNFSAFLPERGAMAAANIIRRDDNYTELNRGIFTACELCDAEGNPVNPTWSVSADKMVRDEAGKAINYQNAVVRIRGVPVLYTPFFSHADPTADRKSGLLAPRFQNTDRRGLSYEQPYLWSISPYQDLVISPQFNTEVSPFLNLDYRRRFFTGEVEAQAGYTYERDFSSTGATFGPYRTKAYILAAGRFAPTEQWRWGFTAEGARNPRLFDQYSIGLPPPDRGLYLADDRRLISQVYTVRQGERSYFSIAAMAFQSLRPVPGPLNVFGVLPLEDDDTLPFVGPLVEFRYEPESEIFGGRLRLVGSGVVLDRDESQIFPGAPGTDSRRATIELDWRRTSTFDNGMRVEPFFQARGDVYGSDDLAPGNTASNSASRGIVTLGLDVSWPFIRVGEGLTTTIEPIVQIALSPDPDFDPVIPNEDSLAFDFDYTTLLEPNKFPGFDLYEGGQRLNVGVRTTFDWGGGRNARLVIGQSFRADPDPIFPPRTGLNRTSSDWVVGAEVTPIAGLSAFASARLNDFDVQRFEGGLDASMSRASGYLRYMRTTADYTGLPQEDVEGAVQVFLTDHWGIITEGVRDLENHAWRQRSIGAVYEDDCLRFELAYQRDNNPILGQRESSSVVVRLTLATLGDSGYRDYRGRRARAFR